MASFRLILEMTEEVALSSEALTVTTLLDFSLVELPWKETLTGASAPLSHLERLILRYFVSRTRKVPIELIMFSDSESFNVTPSDCKERVIVVVFLYNQKVS
jgi:hypothetical protein